MQPVYLLFGVSGSGKTWICQRLSTSFHYIPHDVCWILDGKGPSSPDEPWPTGAISTHRQAIAIAAKVATKPVLTECPFGERGLTWHLRDNCHLKVHPYGIVEDGETCNARHIAREGTPLSRSTLSRAKGMAATASELSAPYGTAVAVLELLTKEANKWSN